MRPDLLEHEPVLVSTSLLSADVGIFTTINQSTTQNVDTTDVIYNFDGLAYIFFAIGVFIISVALTLLAIWKNLAVELKRIRKIKKFFSTFKETLWEIFTLVFDQENYQPTFCSIRIIWTSFSIACFFLIYGYFWNLMSTDQTVERTPQTIDSLKDLLYDPNFKEVTPVIAKMLYLYNILNHVSPYSDEGKIFKRMLETKEKSVLDVNLSNMNEKGPMDHFLEKLVAGKAAMLTVKFAIKIMSVVLPKVLGKVLMNDRNFHVSKNSFLQGTANCFYSRKINRHIKQYMDYR